MTPEDVKDILLCLYGILFEGLVVCFAIGLFLSDYFFRKK